MTKVFSTSYTEKTTPSDNDFVLLTDSADGNKVKKGRFINFKGDKGNTGASITSASIVGDDIVFTKDDTTTVTLTGAVTSLKGEDGREIELQVNATHIQWRYTGDVSWTNLIALSELKGADGACVVSVSFVGDDMVFVLDDASTVSLVGAKTTLKGDDGISFTPKGEYSAGTSYVANDVVSYLGSSWIALQSTTGNTPAEGVYWTLNAAKGADGTGSGDFLANGTIPMTGDINMAGNDIVNAGEVNLGTSAKILYNTTTSSIDFIIN